MFVFALITILLMPETEKPIRTHRTILTRLHNSGCIIWKLITNYTKCKATFPRTRSYELHFLHVYDDLLKLHYFLKFGQSVKLNIIWDIVINVITPDFIFSIIWNVINVTDDIWHCGPNVKNHISAKWKKKDWLLLCSKN